MAAEAPLPLLQPQSLPAAVSVPTARCCPHDCANCCGVTLGVACCRMCTANFQQRGNYKPVSTFHSSLGMSNPADIR